MANASRQDACYRYNKNLTDDDVYCQPYYKHSDANDSSLLEKCHSWDYDTSVFESTIVTDVITMSKSSQNLCSVASP